MDTKSLGSHIGGGSQLSRRKIIANGTTALLSGAAISLLASGGVQAATRIPKDEVSAQDVQILSTALSAEREAIAAYELGIESGLLRADTKGLARAFRDHHREHATALVRTIQLMGYDAPARVDHDFSVESLKNEKDVLQFAASLEQGAVSAYLGAVPLFEDRELSKVAASILGDEAMHWAVLRHALGLTPVPVAFVS